MQFQCLSSSRDDSPWLVGMNTHFIFNSIWFNTSDLIYFPPRYASAKSNFRIKTRISKMVAITAKNEKWQFSTEILKQCSRNNFSYGNPMPGISFSPGLKPAELEQAAELKSYASGGLNIRFHSSGTFTARYLQASWKELHTNCPHLSHRYTCRDNFSISFFQLKSRWIITELLPITWLKKRKTLKKKPKTAQLHRISMLEWNFISFSVEKETKDKAG